MDPTCGLVDKIRDLVLEQIWKQLRYLVYYHRNIEQLHGRLDDLIRERSSLQHRIDEARNNTDEIEENVLYWLRRVDEISEQVQELHRESEAKLEGGITSCPNPWLRCKLSKRAEAIAKEAAEIYGEGNFVTVSYRVPPESMTELTNRESNEGIDSRVGIKNHIMEALRNPRFNMIGLCGLGGVGKTTIAKDIAKEEKNQKVFEKVIMATVSKEMNIGQIQDQIIDKLGMQLNETSEEGKASRLYRRLENEKNMLLILDDLWQELDLGKVGIPFGDVESYSKINEGCKILLTSRNEELLSKSMKCQKVIPVGVLLEDEPRKLFESIAKRSIESSNPYLKSIATEIVQECGGLPLAIATAAKSLKDKNIDGWRDYLARWKHHLARSVTGIREVDTILKLSYNALNQENKDIFLLSAMLSHDPSIEDLLMYSVGLDILKHTQNMGDARNAILDIVGKLKSLNLLLDSFSSHHFTMHDVFRDVALSIGSEELKAVIVWHRRLDEWPPDGSDLECCKGVCLQESDICDLPEELHGPKLEFFFLNSNKSDLTIPNMFFKSSEKLKVLAITNVNFSSLPSLVFLQRLRALCLHSCWLKDITEIRGLRKLKVLSFAYSEIERLPIELVGLTSLQMLNLSHCFNLKEIPQKLLSSFKKLEVLYMGSSFHQWKDERCSEANNENASLEELRDLPISSLDIEIPNVYMLPENLFLKMNLRRYKIFIGRSWPWKAHYKTSNILELELESSIDLTAQLQNLLKGVEDLHFYGSNGQENVLYNLDVSGFPCLRHLQIESNDDIKYIVWNSTYHEDAFPILESLELKNLKALENLCDGPNDIAFRQLHILKMENLPALTGDFNINDRATKKASNKIFKSLFNKVLLPKLEILELSNLNSSIALIFDDQHPHNSFSNLKTLMVERCGFVTLMPGHVLKYLNNLEKLEVRDCDMLENMFDFEYLNYNEEMVSPAVIVPLKRLKLWNLPKLKNVCSNNCQGNWHAVTADLYVNDGATNNASHEISKSLFNKVLLPKLEILELYNVNSSIALISDDQLPHNSFSNLKTLMVERCGFVTLMPGHVVKYLNNLEELQVRDCDILEHMFDFEYLNYNEEMVSSAVIVPLKRLKLWNLPKLKNMCSNNCQGNWHAVTADLYVNDGATNNASNEISKSLFNKVLLPKLEILELSYVNSSIALICDDQLPHNSFSNLKTLMVEGCGFVTLMRGHVLKYLNNLEELYVGDCDILEHMFDFEYLNYNEEMVSSAVIVSLKRLKLWNLPKLKNVCSNNYQGNWHAVTADLYVKDGATNNASNEISKSLFNKVLLPKLEILELSNVNSSIALICDDQLPHNSFSNLKTLMVERCGFVTLMPGHVLKYLNNLEELEVRHCDILEHMFDFEYLNYNEEMVSSAVIVPLKRLKLWNLPKLKNVCSNNCEGNWHAVTADLYVKDGATNIASNEISKSLFNKVLLPKLEILELYYVNRSIALICDDQLPHNSFSNLKILMVERCRFVTLMPGHVLKYLNNLEELDVRDCDMLEHMFDFEYLNYNEEMVSSAVIVPLKRLKLCNLPKLKNVCSNNCQGNWHAVTADLYVKDGATNNASNEISKSLFNKVLLPKLEILELNNVNRSIALIWDDQLSHNSFRNLKTLMVQGCGFVTLMCGHVLKYLNNLEELEVQYCNMLEIVFDFEDLKDDKEMESSSVVVPMKKLKLWYLPKLKNVWSNHHQGNVSFPSLRSVDVSECESLTSIFPASIAKGMLCGLEELEIHQCGVDVIVAKDQVLESAAVTFEFPSLTSLHLSYLLELRNFYPHQHTLKLPHLHRLSIEECDELEIFEKEISSSSEIHEEESTLNSKYPLFSHHDEVIQKLEELILRGREAEMIGSGQFPMYHFPNVKLLCLAAKEATNISYRSLLKSFTKLEDLQLSGNFEKAFGGEDVARFSKLTLSYNFIMRSSSPSLISSPNLTHLNVNRCDAWTTLMTSSIARSLVHLTRLSVDYCCEMEEIITKQEGEDDVDKEIFFKKLESLKLTGLPRLRRFCRHNYTFRFPLLDKLVIYDCPKFKEFSPGLIDTPSLRSVQLSQGYWGEYDEIWDTNLSKTFYQQRYVTSRELVLDEDDAIMIRNDKFPTDRCPQVEILGIKGFVDEWVTFPYTLLERFPKLNALHVENCSFGEIFLSQDHIIHFKGKISPFKDLWRLSISGCHQFIHLVTTSIAKSLVSLWWLEINDCKKMEEIVMNATNEDLDGGITFNKLWKIKLTDMPSLKMFSSQSHTFKFPNLEKIEITGCPEMKVFCRGELKTPKLSEVKIEEHDMKWKGKGDVNKTMKRLSKRRMKKGKIAKGKINFHCH